MSKKYCINIQNPEHYNYNCKKTQHHEIICLSLNFLCCLFARPEASFHLLASPFGLGILQLRRIVKLENSIFLARAQDGCQTLLLLMEEILQQLIDIVYPIIYRVAYIPGGAGFLPSTVCFRVGSSARHLFKKIPLLITKHRLGINIYIYIYCT